MINFPSHYSTQLSWPTEPFCFLFLWVCKYLSPCSRSVFICLQTCCNHEIINFFVRVYSHRLCFKISFFFSLIERPTKARVHYTLSFNSLACSHVSGVKSEIKQDRNSRLHVSSFPPLDLVFSTSLLFIRWRRCPWCNGYRRRKWSRWHEFKS